jgi:hypothetical protein
LRALKLIATEGDTIRSVPEGNRYPNILLRRAASGMECTNPTGIAHQAYPYLP